MSTWYKLESYPKKEPIYLRMSAWYKLVISEEGTSFEKMTQPDWPVGKLLGHFID